MSTFHDRKTCKIVIIVILWYHNYKPFVKFYHSTYKMTYFILEIELHNLFTLSLKTRIY